VIEMPLILIADDNAQIASILEEYVKKEGYDSVTATDGKDTLEKFKEYAPEIILLDVMMPLVDGFEVCRRIREYSNVPIIMITARGEDFERIMGLDIGADDYIVKPFSPSEVMARIRAIMRRLERAEEKVAQVMVFDNLMINLENYTVSLDDKNVFLTKKEIEILWTLTANKNKVFSRENLLNMVWGYEYFGDARTVDSHIKRLRAKLDEFSHPLWDIKTIWGVGYKFEIQDEKQDRI
jgi:DNA-binding response OmpR family regulator